MTHTPGPWEYHIENEDWWVITENRADLLPVKEIAHIFAGYLEEDASAGEEAEDNCRLIAAAPDLLEALKAMLSAYCDEEYTIKLRVDAKHAAIAAIAKVEDNHVR